MVIEYSLTVTNEGGVAGYAKKIADYIPAEFKFNSELNKDWYEGANGTVYNSSLANTIINPGESKTITLTPEYYLVILPNSYLLGGIQLEADKCFVIGDESLPTIKLWNSLQISNSTRFIYGNI